MKTILLKLASIPPLWDISLLLITVSIFGAGLAEIVRGASENVLMLAALVAALAGYAVARSRLKWWQAAGLLAIAGLIIIFARVARLDIPLLELIKSSPIINARIYAWLLYKAPLDLTQQMGILADLYSRMSVLIDRIGGYALGISVGVNMNDPVSRTFAWAAIAWLASAWAGFAVGKDKNSLTALAPIIVVLAIIADYTGRGYFFLWGSLLLTLTLMGLTRYTSRLRIWLKNRIDYSESIPMDTAIALGLIVLGVAAMTYFTPSLSAKALVDALKEISRPKTSQTARSLGLQPSQGSTLPYLSPGLPRSHLLTGGLELEKEIAFIASTGELPPGSVTAQTSSPPRHYWRSIVYDIYTGRGWVSSSVQDVDLGPGETVYPERPPNYRVLNQTIQLNDPKQRRLVWSGMLQSASEPLIISWRTPPNNLPGNIFNGADMLGALIDENDYRAASFIPQVSEGQLREATSEYPAWLRERYTRLPEVPPRVISLAQDITASAATPYDRARAIEKYLRQYPYSLDVPTPPHGQDVVDYFLFDLKTGYCDYYATSMVVLARAAGLPARMVVGYASGNYDPFKAQYTVTEANAHSWVEIYFPEYGWIEFEPTAAFDEFNYTDTSEVQSAPNLAPDTGRPSTLMQTFIKLPPFVKWIAISISALLLGWLIWQLLEVFIASRRSPLVTLTGLYRRLVRHGTFLAGKAGVEETPYEFATRIEHNFSYLPKYHFLAHAGLESNYIIDLYVRATFSQRLPNKKEAIQAIKQWRKLRWKIIFAKLINFPSKRHQNST